MFSKDLQIGLFMIGFSLVLIFWLIPSQVELFSLGGSSEPWLDARSFPYLIAICISLLGTALSITALFAANAPGNPGEPVTVAGWMRVIGVFVITAVYVWLVYLVGYTVPTIAATLALMWLFGEHRWLLAAAISVITAVGLNTIFGNVFHLMMPQGRYELFPWF